MGVRQMSLSSSSSQTHSHSPTHPEPTPTPSARMLCFVVLCCAVQCGALLYCALLCCAALWFATTVAHVQLCGESSPRACCSRRATLCAHRSTYRTSCRPGRRPTSRAPSSSSGHHQVRFRRTTQLLAGRTNGLLKLTNSTRTNDQNDRWSERSHEQ